MIRTKFDLHFREIPFDTHALQIARQKIENDLPSALNALDGAPTELDEIDYYRLLSRASDLDRLEFKYTSALAGFARTRTFWMSIDWSKAAFLCDLKAALCHGYLEPADAFEDRFASLLGRLENNEEELQIYRSFFYQYRGQIFAFHENYHLAEVDFRLALNLSMKAGKKKQIQRFTYFVERVTKT